MKHTKISMFLSLLILLLSLAPTAQAAGMRAQIAAGPTTLNGVKIDNSKAKYPLLVYDDITYFPMTYSLCRFLGLASDWDASTQTLSISKTGERAVYVAETGSASQSGTVPVSRVNYAVYVNGTPVDNQNTRWPLISYQDVTYFPLTWTFAAEAFEWDYAWDAANGLTVSSSGSVSTPSASENPVDSQYLHGEFWRTAENSAGLLPLASGETPAAYFERVQSQAEAEAKRYILEVCLPDLERFQEEYGGTKRGDTFYQESRINHLTPGGVFSTDGVRYLVYTLDYSVQVSPGTQLFLADSMAVSQDGWLQPGSDSILALSLENDGRIQFCFGCQSDIFPDNEAFFQQAFHEMLAQYQMDSKGS